MIKSKFTFWAITLFCLTCVHNTAYADEDIVFDVELQATSDDNLNLATSGIDSISDNFFVAGISASNIKKLSNKTLLSLFGKFQYQSYQKYNTLDNANIKFGISLRHKPSSGYTSPTYSATLDMVLSDFDTDIRDSTFYNVSAQLSKNITTKILTSIGLQFKIRDSDSRVYDTTSSSLFANIDLSLSRSTALYTTYRYISGDSVSSLQTTNPVVLDIYPYIIANDVDSAFGSNYLAYKISTTTHLLTLGLNHVLSGAQSIDFSVQTVSSEAGYAITYQRMIMSLSYLARF